MTDPEGLLLVDKPGGMTSHDVVDVVRRTLGTRKVGHAGTLDPMATGLLILGVGRATRLLRFLGGLPKTYEGSARLGVETTTLDADGEVTAERPVTATEADIRDAMASLVGDSLQAPPAYSAVKVGGRKLYEAARKGEVLEAAPRPIRVDAFALTGYRAPDVDFLVTCSGGTYVRVLLADVGSMLGCGAHLTAAPPHRDRHARRGRRGRPRGRGPAPDGPRGGAPAAPGPRARTRRSPRVTAASSARQGSRGRTRCSRPTERSSASTRTKARRLARR